MEYQSLGNAISRRETIARHERMALELAIETLKNLNQVSVLEAMTKMIENGIEEALTLYPASPKGRSK